MDLPVPVRNDAHWEVVIRPAVFNPGLIGSLAECQKIVEESRVTLRGWDYPHISDANSGRGDDYVASWDQFQHHCEYWQLFQSGQFFHLLAFRENGYKQDFEQRVSPAQRRIPPGFEPSGYIDFVSTVLTVTEILLFASGLAARAPYPATGSAHLRIAMLGVKDRVLTSWDVFRDLWSFYHAAVGEIAWEKDISVPELVADPTDIALQAVRFLFERFGWDDQPVEVFRQDQQKFLQRRF